MPVLRDLAVAALEELLPAAEKAGVTVAIENIIAPTDTIGELLAIFDGSIRRISAAATTPDTRTS